MSDEREDELLLFGESVGKFRRILLWFRAPNIFEVLDITSIVLFWINQILKLVFNSIFNSIEIEDDVFLDMSVLEQFQYAIRFIDYIMGILIALAFIKYMSMLFNQIKFIMTYLNKFITSVFLWLTIILIFYSLIFAIQLMTALSFYAYGYCEYFQALVACFWMFTRGSLFYEHDHLLYKESYKSIIRRTTVIIFVNLPWK